LRAILKTVVPKDDKGIELATEADSFNNDFIQLVSLFIMERENSTIVILA